VERLSLHDAPSLRPAAGPLVRVTVAALNPKDALFRKAAARTGGAVRMVSAINRR
jgi:hypothetical protein